MTNTPETKKPKQTEQERLLEIQSKHAPKSKAADIITILGLIVTIYFFSLLTIFYPDAAFSEQENRMLQQKPTLSTPSDGTLAEKIKDGKFLDRLIDGKFTGEISKYFQDQFPLRNVYIGIKGVSEVALLKQEVNGVMIGRDGNIITRHDYPGTDGLDKNIFAYNVFAAEMETRNIPVTFAVAGRTMDTLASFTPALYTSEFSDEIWAHFDSEMAAVTRPYLNLLPALREKAEAGEYVQYRTDHHWTTLGAYYAYVEIMDSMNIEPLDITYFTRETVSESFYGTAWSTAGMKWVKPDAIEFFRYEGDGGYTMEIYDTETVISGFYDESYLEKKDKYSSFIAGNNAHVRITKDGASDRQTLLLIKDSFAHSVAPFLAAHFDLEIIDLRYYKQPTIDLIESANVSSVLLLFNMDNLTAAQPVLNLLRSGIK